MVRPYSQPLAIISDIYNTRGYSDSLLGDGKIGLIMRGGTDGSVCVWGGGGGGGTG